MYFKHGDDDMALAQSSSMITDAPTPSSKPVAIPKAAAINTQECIELMTKVVGPLAKPLQEKWNQMLEENKMFHNKINQLENKCAKHHLPCNIETHAKIQYLQNQNKILQETCERLNKELLASKQDIKTLERRLNLPDKDSQKQMTTQAAVLQEIELNPKQPVEMEKKDQSRDNEKFKPLMVEWKSFEPNLSWDVTWHRWFFCDESHDCMAHENDHYWKRCSSMMEWVLTQSMLYKITQVTIGDHTVNLVYPGCQEKRVCHVKAIQTNNETKKQRKLFIGASKIIRRKALEQLPLIPMSVLQEIYQGCSEKVMPYTNLWNIVQEKLDHCAEEWHTEGHPHFQIKLKELKRVMNNDQVLRFFSRVDAVIKQKGGNKTMIAWSFHGYSDAKLNKLLSTGLKNSMADRYLWGRGNYMTSNVLECLKSNYTQKSKSAGMDPHDETTCSSSVLLVAAIVSNPLLLTSPLMEKGLTTTKPLIINDTIVPCIIGPISQGSSIYNLCCTDDMDVLITHVVKIGVSRIRKLRRFTGWRR